jgi:hypothetical protein
LESNIFIIALIFVVECLHSVGYFSTYSDKIYQFLRDCINSSFSSLNLFAESTPDPVHLLSEVEKRLDSMMVEISRVDPEFRAQVEKVKDAERRERARAERLEQQRLHDEERIRRSRARAIMAGELAMKAKLKPQMFKTVLKKRGQETTQAGHDANAEEEQTKKFFAVY